jgi:hypothetical protein
MQAGAASSMVAIHVFVSRSRGKMRPPPHSAAGRDVNNLSRTDHNAVNAPVLRNTSILPDDA